MDPIVDADKRAFTAAANHGHEDRHHARDNNHNESVGSHHISGRPAGSRHDRTQRDCVRGDQRGGPAAASRAREQWARRQQAEKARAVSHENPRHGDRGVQDEDYPEPNWRPAHCPGCTSQ